MYATIKRYNSDIVVGVSQSFNLFRKWKHEHFALYFKYPIVNTHIKKHIFLSWDVSPCNKLYRREFLVEKKLTFPEKTAKEDVYFTRTAYFESKKVGSLVN